MTPFERRFAKRMVAVRAKRRRCAAPRMRGPKPPLWKPVPGWVLAVDAARDSGWALYAGGALLRSGSCNIDNVAGRGDEHDELARVCRMALDVGAPFCTAERERSTVLVFERPFKSGHVNAYVGIGAAQGAWKRAWVLAGGGKTRVVYVHAATWRARVLGHVRGATREQWKALAVARVRSMHPGSSASDDEAEAILMGVCASFMPEVLAKLPKRVREAA